MVRTKRKKYKRKSGSIKSNARKKISTQTKKVFADCPICIERIHKEDRAETICGHFFHRNCINAWCLSKANSKKECECPVCRSYLFDMTNLANMKIVEKANKNLLSACISGNLEDFNKAINNGANINVKSKTFFGYTPVHNASTFGHSEIVKLLIEKGSNINAKDKIGDTSLHMAINIKNLVIVKLLIQAGADINAKTDLEITPLHLAVQKKEGLEYVKLLLEADAEIDAKDSDGDTPICAAIENNNFESAKLLKEAGADLDNEISEIRDKYNEFFKKLESRNAEGKKKKRKKTRKH